MTGKKQNGLENILLMRFILFHFFFQKIGKTAERLWFDKLYLVGIIQMDKKVVLQDLHKIIIY